MDRSTRRRVSAAVWAAGVPLIVAIVAGCGSWSVGVGGSSGAAVRDVAGSLSTAAQSAPGRATADPAPSPERSAPSPVRSASASVGSVLSTVAGGSGPSASPSAFPFAPRIGYISLDDDLAFASATTVGVRAATQAAGLELVECDPDWTPEGVLACASRLGEIGVDALISFQPFPDLAEQVCELTGMVPTAGIHFDQGPCQVSRLIVDQAEAGRLAGEAVGRFVRERWDCEVSAFVSLESSDADPDGRARMAGYRTGYEEVCPLPRRAPALDGADRLVTAQSAVARLLPDLRGRRIVVVGINEDAILGAMAAAEEAGRERDLWFSGQLADPVMRGHIACNDRYIASVAQFPERFGELLVPLMVDAMEGRAVPQVVEAPLELVDAGNVRELFPDTPACTG